MSAIHSSTGNLILDSINIVGADGKGIDFKKSLKEFHYSQEIGLFNTGRLILATQYPLRQTFPLKGKEKVVVSWSSSYDAELLVRTFIMYQLNDIVYQEQVPTDSYSFTLLDEKFEKFLTEYAYQKHFFNKTIAAMMKEIFDYYGVELVVETTDTTTASYNTYSDDVLTTINDILMLFKNAHCLIPTETGFKLTTYELLFQQTNGFKYTTKSIQPGSFRQDTNALKIVRKFDVINNKEIYEDGYNGYKFFDIDIFAKKFSLSDIDAATNTKYEFTSGKRNIRMLPTRKFEENEMYMEGLECALTLPTINVKVGDLIELEVDEPINPDKESYYNGVWAIHSIHDLIDANYNFNRTIRLIRK